MHDIGILAIDACLSNEEAQIIEKMQRGMSQLEAERVILDGLTHCDIGAWLCKRSGFPEDIVRTVQYHHAPHKTRKYKDIIKILAIANILGTDYIKENIPVNIDVLMDENLREELGLTNNDLNKIVQKLPALISKYTPRPIGF